MMSAPIARPLGQPPAVTRFCFRYRSSRHHARLYDVLIMLDEEESACRIEIRHAGATRDDVPPLSCGRLSAARLRTAVGLLGLIERMTRIDKTANVPGTLVNIAHLKGVLRPHRTQGVRKSGRVRDNRERRSRATRNASRQPPSQGGAAHLSGEPLARALAHTSVLLARARRRYPVRRP